MASDFCPEIPFPSYVAGRGGDYTATIFGLIDTSTHISTCKDLNGITLIRNVEEHNRLNHIPHTLSFIKIIFILMFIYIFISFSYFFAVTVEAMSV